MTASVILGDRRWCRHKRVETKWLLEVWLQNV